MPALTIPQCGFSVGSAPDIDDGIERVTSLGGVQRGWTDFDAPKQVYTIVFEICSFAEATAQLALYNTNRLTGGMTFTAPWDATAYTADYAAPPKFDYRATNCRVTLKLRQQ